MIYLASASPRRRELLDQIGVSYALLPVAVDEQISGGESAEAYVERLARAKAAAGWQTLQRNPDAPPVLAADTAVVVDDRILGKPEDRDDGLAMLAALSGRCHRVLTAVALMDGRQTRMAINTTEVCFRTLSAAERAAYWSTGEALDKAGAYAIQGRAAKYISRIDGSYSGVVGLPLFETAELLRAAGIEVDV
jgi:septum formation protein